MNIVWTSLILISIIILTLTNPNQVFFSLVAGSEKAITLAVKLWAIYAVWLGLLNLITLTELDKKISRLFSPVLKFLFGELDDNTKHQLSINITGNVFGIGSASVPSGMQAMKLMYEKNKGKFGNKLTTPMTMLILINCCNLQVIPSTIIGLRMLAGSTQPANIILPSIIVSLLSLCFGITLVKLSSRRSK